MTLKLGKKPARPDAVNFKFSAFFNKAKLPTPPAVFGHWNLVRSWGMLGNDEYGDCVLAGAGHETMMWCAEVGKRTLITTDDALSDYSSITGFNKSDPNSDQGTDMSEAASYRRKTGIIDAGGQRHKIDSYVALERGSLSDLMVATYMFGATGVGILFPDSAMQQFNDHKPWSVVPGEKEPTDGHYIPVIGRNAAGNILCVTWGRLHAMTPDFYRRYSDEALAYVSLEPLQTRLISPEGYDVAALRQALKGLAS